MNTIETTASDLEKIGDGIDGVISQEDIISGINSHSVALFYNNVTKKWKMGPNIASSYNNNLDLEVDLEHDVNLEGDDFGENYTVTDYISEGMSNFEDEAQKFEEAANSNV